MSSDIVTVDISALAMPDWTFDYAILCDRSLDEVIAFSDSHPHCFVFPFHLGPVSAVDDFSGLSSDYIAVPFYIGNLRPRDLAIKSVLDSHMGGLKGRGRCILDETPPTSGGTEMPNG